MTGETDRQRLCDALVLADRQRVEAMRPGPKARAALRAYRRDRRLSAAAHAYVCPGGTATPGTTPAGLPPAL